MSTPKHRADSPSRCGSFSGGNQLGRRWTTRAPTVMPNIATEMAMKAKWYQRLMEKIRVSRISKTSVARVTRNSPTYTERGARATVVMKKSLHLEASAGRWYRKLRT